MKFNTYTIDEKYTKQIQELFRQCGIFCFSVRFRNCSDSVVFFVFLLDLGTVPTVWYFLFFYQIQELFRQCGIFCFSIIFRNCSDSVVFFVFRLDLGTVPTVWYFLVYILYHIQCTQLVSEIIFISYAQRQKI